MLRNVLTLLAAIWAAERKLASLRQLTQKVISKRQPIFLRDNEGQQVEDESRWSGLLGRI